MSHHSHQETKIEDINNLKTVNQALPKIDGLGLVKGKAAYTDDFVPQGALVVKILRSPHAFARIKDIRVDKAQALPGVACVLTHKDVPRNAITRAGQGHPEPSPKDKFILDEYVRYVGDDVAVIAAEDESTALAAMKAVEVDYEVLEPVLDFEKARGHKSIIHPEKEIHEMFPIGLDPAQNTAAAYEMEIGDVEKTLASCPKVVRETYYTQAQAHVALEPHAAFTYQDVHERINVVTSTQNPFHTRRLMAEALGIPVRKIRVQKPRIGGGFGGKQMLHVELFCTLVTQKTGRPAWCRLTRKEVFESTTCRHAMRLDVSLGSDEEGNLKAIDMRILSDTGAYGEHALTVFMVAGSKTLPLYNKVDAVRFGGKIVYTNHTPAGAYRGYGAIQGNFALESAMDELAEKLGMDAADLRAKNMIAQGETSGVFKIMGEGSEGVEMYMESCGLDQCLKRGKELIGWKPGSLVEKTGPHTVRAKGLAIAMQGSGIPLIDMGSATLEFQDDGFFKLLLGATDLGTGSDTILAQIAAETLGVPLERIIVYSSDTDRTPYDVGAYASSTTYVSGNAVIRAAEKMVKELTAEAARKFGVTADQVEYNGMTLSTSDGSQSLELTELGNDLLYHDGADMKTLTATGSFSGEKSPPPFLAGLADVEVDTETGSLTIHHFVAVADCGTAINPNLAKIQVEGGVLQGIGMTVFEDVRYNPRGQMLTNNLMTYKIPTRQDVKKITAELVETCDPSGPFGAKSVGEIGIDTPLAAIANAVYRATGKRVRQLPLTPEAVLS